MKLKDNWRPKLFEWKRGVPGDCVAVLQIGVPSSGRSSSSVGTGVKVGTARQRRYRACVLQPQREKKRHCIVYRRGE